ncbi:hypothetical protein KUTeg_019297 [Tegillarca granosa]|uniref:Uncharacterized protein n=1 Tax=Tegillarca granosa TaxID=220873 RepID=A0ABQ9EC31_TEGGR|nr:hypothetical protein KUTeg_019297 [Tegillarca granosa]
MDVYSQEKEQMETKKVTLEEKKENALTIVKLIEKEENDLDQNGETAKENIRAQFETCFKILERRRDELLEDVDITMSRKRKILEVHRQGLEDLNDSITDAISFYDQSLLYKNYPAFLQIVTTMKNRFEYLIDQKIDVIPHENACCEFSALNMGMEFQKYINATGKMYHTSAYLPNTMIKATLPESKDKEVLISVIFRDKSGNEITDADTLPDVTVRITSETKSIDPVELPCESSPNGKYNAVIKGLSPGKYKFEAVMFKKCFGSDVKEIEYKNNELQEPDEVEKAENQLPMANAEKDPGELSFTFNPLTLHKDRYISDDCLTISNKEQEGIKMQNDEQAFTAYKGVKGSTPIAYPENYIIEVEINYTIIQDLPNNKLIFRIGFLKEEEIEDNVNKALSIHAAQCPQCNKVCLVLYHKQKRVKHIPLSNTTKNVSFTGRFTTLINSRQREIEVLDEQYVQIFLYTDVDFDDELWPVFGVYNKDLLLVKLQLIKAKIGKYLTLPKNQTRCESSEKEM